MPEKKQIGSIFSSFGGQDTSEPVEQLTSKPVHRQASKPVHRQASKLVKATYYIEPDQDMKLERIRLARRAAGQTIDKSALVREALELLQE